MKRTINIVGEIQRQHVLAVISNLPLVPVHEVTVKLRKTTRSLEQNSRLWAMLADISTQVVWHGHKLTKESWKDIFSASLKRQAVVPGIDGGFVVLGQSTSKMSVSEMSELMELMTAFGVQNGVKFTDRAEEPW